MSGEIDSRTIQDANVPGLAYSVTVDYDYAYDRPEGDGFTPKQIEAFQRNDWHYVCVQVTPVIDGDPIEMARTGLGCVEYGYFTSTDEDDNITKQYWIDLDSYINGTTDEDGKEHWEAYPVPDLLDEAKDLLVKTIGPKIDALRAVYLALPVAV